MSETKAAAPTSAREVAKNLKAEGMKCNCDLDSWQPELLTGHSWVCRIHKAVIVKIRGRS